jgi:hypothetical protein
MQEIYNLFSFPINIDKYCQSVQQDFSSYVMGQRIFFLIKIVMLEKQFSFFFWTELETYNLLCGLYCVNSL